MADPDEQVGPDQDYAIYQCKVIHMARQQIGGPRRHVILSRPQDDKLLRLAGKTGLTPSEHIRRALDSYFRALDLVEARRK